MDLLYRNGTEPALRRPIAGLAALVASATLLMTAGPVYAQQQEPADEQQSIEITCDDGSTLQAAFDDKGVDILRTIFGG